MPSVFERLATLTLDEVNRISPTKEYSASVISIFADEKCQ
jgi:hypothetical protein